MVSCVENLVHIQIFDNGSFSVKYNSIGHKNDLLDSDFIHPTSNNKHNWITSLRQTNKWYGEYMGKRNHFILTNENKINF